MKTTPDSENPQKIVVQCSPEDFTEPETKLPYKLGSPQDPHFQDHGGNWTPDRSEANEDYYSSLDEGRSWGEGESFSERNV